MTLARPGPLHPDPQAVTYLLAGLLCFVGAAAQPRWWELFARPGREGGHRDAARPASWDCMAVSLGTVRGRRLPTPGKCSDDATSALADPT